MKAHPDNIRLPFLEALQPTTTLNFMMEFTCLAAASANKDQLNQDFSEVRSSDTVALNATATSNLPVVYELIDGNTAKLEGSTLQILTAGQISIRVHQSGNETYNPASLVRIISIEKLTQEITWRQGFAGVAYGNIIDLLAETSSELDVVYDVLEGSAIISGDQLTITRPSISIVAKQSGDALYASADPVVQTFIAGKAPALLADGKSGRTDQPIPEGL